MKIEIITARNHESSGFSKEATVAFLYKHLGRFTDTETAIFKAIDYALSPEAGKGNRYAINPKGDRMCRW